MNYKLLDTFLADGFYLTQEYGTNKYFDYTKYGLLYHEGVDFSHTNKTKEIRCVHGGECLTAYDNAYGRYVIVLDYSQLCATWYCHLSQAKIVNGQKVKAGDVIGNMGTTGNSTGNHLHFNFVIINSSGNRLYKEARYNQGFLDPLYPRDPSTPKKMGINYDIEWVKTLETSMSNTISIAKDTFEKLVQKSTNYDTITKYLIPEANPDTTTAEQLINVVAGIKSRATDQENKAVKAEAELANKIDEISRLKSEIANLESLVKQTEDSLNSNVKQYKILIDEYKGQLTTKQGEIDRLAKELGEANITLAECGTKKEFTEIFELKLGGKVYKFVVMK